MAVALSGRHTLGRLPALRSGLARRCAPSPRRSMLFAPPTHERQHLSQKSLNSCCWARVIFPLQIPCQLRDGNAL